jgi:hypothetical protein
MTYLKVTSVELAQVKSLEARKRKDWKSGFSTNPQGEIWPFVVRGLTPEEQRENIRGRCSVIDKIADELLRIRPEGGRFFVEDMWATYKNENGHLKPIALLIEGELCA